MYAKKYSFIDPRRQIFSHRSRTTLGISHFSLDLFCSMGRAWLKMHRHDLTLKTYFYCHCLILYLWYFSFLHYISWNNLSFIQVFLDIDAAIDHTRSVHNRLESISRANWSLPLHLGKATCLFCRPAKQYIGAPLKDLGTVQNKLIIEFWVEQTPIDQLI